MYLLVSIVHVIVCFILIMVILLQAGRGGGLSEMFGGGLTQNEKLFGTETNTFLKKATSYSAIIFIITCITLGVLTVRKGRSLVEGQDFKPVFNEQKVAADAAVAAQAAAAAPATVPAPATTVPAETQPAAQPAGQ